MAEDELDRMLDTALERYSKVEPLAGLPERILFRVRSQRRSSMKGWIAAGAVATALLASMFAVHVARRPKNELIAQPKQLVAQTRDTPQAVPVVVRRRAHRRNRYPISAKQPVFPLPTPMTPEEKSLAILASQKRGSFPDLDKDMEPIVIAPVEVKPIEIELITTQQSQSGEFTHVESNKYFADPGDSSRQ